MMEFWGMWSTHLLSSLPGLLWPRVVAHYMFLLMEFFDTKYLHLYEIELFEIELFDLLTVSEQTVDV